MTTTDHLQKIPDYFLDLNEIKRKYIQTNPRYQNFYQTHFTAGDDQQFQFYRDYSNDKNKKIRLPLIDTWKIDNIDCKLYHNLSKKYVYTTFKYLFDKFKKAIFVKIKDNQLKVFLPFSNANYINEWSDYIKQDHSRWNTLNDFLRYSSNLQGFNIEDKHINSFVETWYGNNCLVRPEYPVGEGDSGVGGVKDMLIELCKNRELPDIEFFINKRDFPLLKKDLTEPYHSLFNNKNLPLLSHRYDKYYPILSMVTSDEYADIAIPTLEDWARISNIEDGKFFIPPRSYKHNFSRPFSERKPIAVFRGASTGEGTTIDTNIRLKLAYLSSLNKKDEDDVHFLDCGITKWNLRPRKEYGKKFLSTIEIKSIPIDLSAPLTPEQQTEYKYIINVDGHVSAFRLSLEMNMGSVILLVESNYKLWYHNLLIPNVHYIPIKKDLSDLYDKIKWCKANDKKCEQISINARQFYNKFLTKNGIFDYFQFLLIKLRKNMGENYYNCNTIDGYQEVLENNELNNPDYTLDKKEIKINKTLLERNGVTIYQIQDEDKVLKTTIEISKNINKHKESLHEFFISKKCLEDVYKFIPNFIKCYKYSVETTPTDNKSVLIIREWIDGITLSEWIKSPHFTIQTFSEILLQVNLALYTAQSLCGFIHNDLYPWNIIIKRYTQPVIIKYPYEDGKIIELKTTHIPFIIDYGKSSAVYNGVRYGSLRISTIQDTITFLLSSLFESLKNQNVDIKKILEYSNFISNTDFRPKKFLKIQELKPFLKTMKKYNKLSQMNKGILEQKTPIDFIKYIIKDTHCSIKERELVNININNNLKINYKDLNPDDLETIYTFKTNPDLVSTLFLNTTPEKMAKLLYNLQNLQNFSLKIENYKKVDLLQCSDLEYLDISPDIKIEELKTIAWKEYSSLTKIYVCNPKITFSVYSHSTYLFYLKLLLENNIKNSKVFSKKISEKFKELIKKL